MATPDPRHSLIIALIKARHDAGLTQRQLAERLDLGRGTVGNWESGARQPRLDALDAWASALGLRLALAIPKGAPR